MTFVTIKKRSDTTEKFYVYYNEWTGEIMSVGRSLDSSITYPCIHTENKFARQILVDNANRHNYIVDLTSSDLDLIKKDNLVRLKEKENYLCVIPESKSTVWDIKITFYTANNIMTVELNDHSVRRLTNLHIKSELKLAEKRNLNLFVIKKNQPDWLIKTFQIDVEELLENKIVECDVTDLIKYTSLPTIGLLTQRNFENYQYSISTTKYVKNQNQFGSIHGRIQKAAKDFEDSHLIFEQYGSVVEVKSNIAADQFAQYGLFSNIQNFYIVKDSPDQLLQTVPINITTLRSNKTVYFQTKFDIDSINIIHRNERLLISKRKHNDASASN